MILTEKSIKAMNLGMDLQFLNWNAFSHTYGEKRDVINEYLTSLDIPIELPKDIGSFREMKNLRSDIYDSLSKRRTLLGGDLTLLPMFFYGYLPFEIIVSAAMDFDGQEGRLSMFKGLLQELGVSGEIEEIKKTIDTEVRWLKEDFKNSADETIEIKKVQPAMLRLINRIGTAWSIAQKNEAYLPFDNIPLYSVFISYSTVDQEFCTKLHEKLVENGIRVWYAPHNIQAGKKNTFSNQIGNSRT